MLAHFSIFNYIPLLFPDVLGNKYYMPLIDIAKR